MLLNPSSTNLRGPHSSGNHWHSANLGTKPLIAPPAFTSKILGRTIYACFHFTVPSLLLKVEDSSKGTAGREVRSSLGWLDSHPNTASGNTLFLEDITIWSLDLYTSKNHIFPELELIWPVSRLMMIKLILIYKHVFQYQFIIRIHTCFLWTRILMPTRFTIAFCFFPQPTTEVKFLYSFLSILRHTFFFSYNLSKIRMLLAADCVLQLLSARWQSWYSAFKTFCWFGSFSKS